MDEAEEAAEVEVAAVGAIAIRDSALLLVQRGHAPDAGKWSIPGGRVEPGETDAEAVVREMAEETGFSVHVVRLAGEIVRPGPSGGRYRIRDYVVDIIGGTALAGDDAADLAWVPFADLGARELTSGLLDALTEWTVLP